MASCSVSQNVDTELGQAPTFQARPRDTDLRPSNLAAKTLSLVDHTLSKFGGGPCPVRRGITAAVMCYVRKARFSAAVQQNEGSQSLVWVSTPQRGKPALSCVFRSHNCWPYSGSRHRREYISRMPFRFWFFRRVLR